MEKLILVFVNSSYCILIGTFDTPVLEIIRMGHMIQMGIVEECFGWDATDI